MRATGVPRCVLLLVLLMVRGRKAMGLRRSRHRRRQGARLLLLLVLVARYALKHAGHAWATRQFRRSGGLPCRSRAAAGLSPTAVLNHFEHPVDCR